MHKTHGEEQHTGRPGCPACAKVAAESSTDNPQTKELVDGLMRQFDGMVDAGAVKLKGFAKSLLAEVKKL